MLDGTCLSAAALAVEQMRTMNLEPGDADTQGDTATHTVSGTEGKDNNDDAEVDDGPTTIEAHEEWTFLLRSHWTKVKGLYIIIRYGPFFLIIVDLLTFASDENPKKCQILSTITACFSIVLVISTECISPSSQHTRAPDLIHPGIFVTRTYALWNKNRIVLIGMLSTLVAIIVASIGTSFTAVITPHHSAFVVTASAMPGCNRSSPSILFSVPCILLFVFQLELVSLTLIRAIQSWRSTRGTLRTVLVKHNIFYYTCGLLLSAVNILVPMILSDSTYYPLSESLQVFILAILATRMHLHLWHIDRHAHR
ncbi:hypothetical protein EDB19DRAFT_2042004 [Suillus lakei]|nr:hypothetical protein EDB19DRAFT_2042004 [Suillus lakei]